MLTVLKRCSLETGLTDLVPGRKEILMFFYLYALIELLAIFLDSGIIPTASSVYLVRVSVARVMKDSMLIWFAVVHRSLHRVRSGCLLLSAHQRVRRLPVCRRWNTSITLGTDLSS